MFDNYASSSREVFKLLAVERGAIISFVFTRVSKIVVNCSKDWKDMPSPCGVNYLCIRKSGEVAATDKDVRYVR